MFARCPPRSAAKKLPETPTPDGILNAFLDYLTATEVEPYGHQEEAILDL